MRAAIAGFVASWNQLYDSYRYGSWLRCPTHRFLRRSGREVNLPPDGDGREQYETKWPTNWKVGLVTPDQEFLTFGGSSMIRKTDDGA